MDHIVLKHRNIIVIMGTVRKGVLLHLTTCPQAGHALVLFVLCTQPVCIIAVFFRAEIQLIVDQQLWPTPLTFYIVPFHLFE